MGETKKSRRIKTKPDQSSSTAHFGDFEVGISTRSEENLTEEKEDNSP